MKIKRTSLLLITSILLSGNSMAETKKSIVGQIENIKIKELNLNMLARIDTGAKTTSINAKNIKVIGHKEKSEDLRDHLGDKVSFTVETENGETMDYVSDIVRVVKIRNAQGVERRFLVNLTLVWNGKEKKIQVNLRNREKLEYKLLIGRDWLMNDYLVDVNKKATK